MLSLVSQQMGRNDDPMSRFFDDENKTTECVNFNYYAFINSLNAFVPSSYGTIF